MSTESKPIIIWDDSRAEAQNNCACSEIGTYEENILGKKVNQRWQQAKQTISQPVADGYTLFINPLAQSGPVLLNDAGVKVFDKFVNPQPLEEDIARKLAELGLLQPIDWPDFLESRPAQMLTAWLHITNACNLRCSYCYINKSNEAMDETTAKAAIEAIIRSAIQHNYSTVKLKYAGGEATLNFHLLKTVHEYAEALALQNNLVLIGVVLSNGVSLTNAMLDYIREHKLTLMISLDGSQAEHDKQRIFLNGVGSYDYVMRGVERAIAKGVQPHLSITVTEESVHGLSEAVAFALKHQLLFNVNFYRQHTMVKVHDDMKAEDDRLIAALLSAFEIIKANPPKASVIGTLVDRSNFAGLHQHSCGAGHDYLVIDHQGGVASCQMEIEESISTVYADDPLLQIRRKATGFQNLAVEEKEGCRTCEWRYWCAGGCPLLTYRVTGRNDIKSPYCNVYKEIYPELMQVEGLRLLRWQPQVFPVA